ncbi:alpha-amylase [Subsaximicrobium wynnwilliamsii]|uniref:Alpha-amylase n=1 Tax=Subsaximicrobium wynnwilliamsii TaxID=291179 RepID=A0A5C6ZPH5_9FLAO|nr:alpha-amylase family glycosyl hydrolase [Subsaximicrobium wynnwilliamsii]TXD85563.1 alpha-amylase [Subsaximicrobium wynnwilliamsii]TXD90916.1 alpha-amylase [Subsaximicrobium wynnwilliamsii]TXE05423.1 alpha-amylase [Subsaximicrobium wynnwilliamsii]
MKHTTVLIAIVMSSLFGCKTEKTLQEPNEAKMETKMETNRKEVVYQVFTRLFGNTNTTNKPWGTLEENGVGKFNDFTDKALNEIKDLGVTYIWYTGVPHHDVITDYTEYGISNDDPDIVKGRAGSPYAVKDYYNVNPDLAENVENRLAEFEALIERSHKAGLKVIIDIVPNHVARNYQSLTNPEGVTNFGAEDDTTVVYDVNNNFYYNPGEAFKVPNWKNGYQPLGGEKQPLADGKFEENPAKWTGNGSRASQPDMNDWYETIKVNYGVSPDGDKDFDELPQAFENKDYQAHYAFWNGKTVPSSWKKFKDIALYWTQRGVDGFRFDMAEMVPVEFWSYMNSAIKTENPDAFLLAEVYNPSMYREYIKKGKMDYLYDKVQLYDTLKHVMQGRGKTDYIPPIQEDLKDIEHHMLHFLENHDEQRIASPDFAGSAEKGKPAMVVSATISSSPTMIYFGQEFGEAAKEDLGFGDPTRTSIFDYGSVPSVVRWVNDNKFDGGKSTEDEKQLRDFYKRLLNFTINSSALVGQYEDIHSFNRQNTEWYNDQVLSYVRWSDDEKLVVISNFNAENTYGFELQIPSAIIEKWNLEAGEYEMKDQLYKSYKTTLKVEAEKAYLRIDIKPLESFILKLE